MPIHCNSSPECGRLPALAVVCAHRHLFIPARPRQKHHSKLSSEASYPIFVTLALRRCHLAASQRKYKVLISAFLNSLLSTLCQVPIVSATPTSGSPRSVSPAWKILCRARPVTGDHQTDDPQCNDYYPKVVMCPLVQNQKELPSSPILFVLISDLTTSILREARSPCCLPSPFPTPPTPPPFLLQFCPMSLSLEPAPSLPLTALPLSTCFISSLSY